MTTSKRRSGGRTKRKQMRKAVSYRWSFGNRKKLRKTVAGNSDYAPSSSVVTIARGYIMRVRKKVKAMSHHRSITPLNNLADADHRLNDDATALTDIENDEDPIQSIEAILPLQDLRRFTQATLSILVNDGYWKFLGEKCERYFGARSQASQNAVVIHEEELPLSFLISNKLQKLMDRIAWLINAIYNERDDSNFLKASCITVLSNDVCNHHSYKMSSAFL
jgi:hypothetical protein